MKLIQFAIYLGIGAMLHALFVGSTFDWTSAWTFGWLFGWPIMLVFASCAVALVGLIVGGLIWAVWSWIEIYANWRARRRRGV